MRAATSRARLPVPRATPGARHRTRLVPGTGHGSAGLADDYDRAVEINKVGVVGLGTMGAGIAQLSVQSGFDTVGREVSDELAQRGRGTIERYLTRGVEKGRLSQAERDAALGRLTLTTELADLAGCDLVIEAVL